MNHHDSIIQADKKMAQTAKQLRHWKIPATPINYAIAYEFISGKNQALIDAIKQQFSFQQSLDDFFLNDIYKQHVLKQSKFRDEIITDLDDLLTDVETSNFQASKAIDTIIDSIDSNLSDLQSENRTTATTALKKLFTQSRSVKLKQQQLAEQLLASQQKAKLLKNELNDVRKEIFSDPITGLFNRKALNKHIEEWLSNDQHKSVAAIVINVDEFKEVTAKFGPLISDVLLSKIASKVNSYVDDSGLPFRSANNEFLILLPEVSGSMAGDIAEKIRHGVEKLRFVSSKSGMRLPQLTISLGVNNFSVSNNINNAIYHTRTFMSAAKNNSVTIVKDNDMNNATALNPKLKLAAQ